MPELRAPAVSPSVMLTVSQPSKAAPDMIGKEAGLAPPVLAPNGAASWYEGPDELVAPASGWSP